MEQPATSLDELLRRVARGDRTALEIVYRRTEPRLLGIVLRIVRRRAVAEEVLQEVYLKLWWSAGRFDPGRGSASSFLATMARNLAIDTLRRQREAVHDDPDAARRAVEAVPDPGALPDASVDLAALSYCLGRLGDQEREAVLMAYYEGLSRTELAERTGRPVGTVKTGLRRALIALRACIGEHS